MAPKSDKFTEDFDASGARIGDVVDWKTVSRVHRVRNGIYQKDGRLVSLLTDFGKITPAYPDYYGSTDEGVIHYTGSGRRGDQKADVFNRALLAAIETRHPVPLFCKIGVNRWRFLGFWRVASGEYVYEENRERMVWRFRLERNGDGA